MRILDDASEKKLDSVTIFLTKEEMRELIAYATQLLSKPSSDHHHLSSADYQKEITICIYDPKNTESFSPKIEKLLQKDEY